MQKTLDKQKQVWYNEITIKAQAEKSEDLKMTRLDYCLARIEQTTEDVTSFFVGDKIIRIVGAFQQFTYLKDENEKILACIDNKTNSVVVYETSILAKYNNTKYDIII